MQTNHPSSAPDYYEMAGNLRSGDRKATVLLNGEEGAPDNYRLGYDPGGDSGVWTTPRHHHNFEQVRFPLKGDYSIGKDQVLPEGWVAYFPESAYYGPQVLSPNLELLVLQLGGPSGNGFASVAQRRKGYDALIARGGKFEDGFYTWTDEDGKRHNQDAFEAVWEQMNGKKISYPESRYESIILMNPASFNWVKDHEHVGVAHKWLGTFTERELKIGFIQLDEGASLSFGTAPSAEVMYLVEGELSHEDTTYPVQTAFGSAKSDKAEELIATKPSELFYIKLHTF